MPESYVGYREGSGKAFAGWQRTIGANTVFEPRQVPGEMYWPTYVAVATNVSTATSGSILIQVAAGSTNPLRIRRMRIRQANPATAAATLPIELYRMTAVATGGTTLTPESMDNPDSAFSGVVRTLPTGGTGAFILDDIVGLTAAAGPNENSSWTWIDAGLTKPFMIPAGTTNALALLTSAAVAGATVDVEVEFTELSY